MGNLEKLVKDLKAQTTVLAEQGGTHTPSPVVAQQVDVTLAKGPEQNYAYLGTKKWDPFGPNRPAPGCDLVQGPGAFEDSGKLKRGGGGRRPDIEKVLIDLSSKFDKENPPLEQAKKEIETTVMALTLPEPLKKGMVQKLMAHDEVKGMRGMVGHLAQMGLAFGTGKAMEDISLAETLAGLRKLIES